MALGDIALAPAVMGGIHCQAEHAVFVGDGALDMIVDPGCVATHIKLEHPQRVGRGFCNVLKAGIADRAQHVRTAELSRRFHDWCGAFFMKAFQRADRAQDDRQPQLAAENFRRDVDLADIAQHARPERNRIERHAVTPQRRFGLDGADDVIPGVLIEIGAGAVDDFVQVQEFIAFGCGFQECGFVKLFRGHCGSTRCWLRDKDGDFSG